MMINTNKMLSFGVLLPRLAVEQFDFIVHYGANAINLFFFVFALTAER